MIDQGARDRGGAKWDKAARYLRIAMALHGNPGGISAQDIANRIGVSNGPSTATSPRWRWTPSCRSGRTPASGEVEEGAFLPPLALTLHEAMTLFLAARVLAKASDEHDTELIGAFVKLAEVLPPVLAEHVRATVDAYATTPTDMSASRACSGRSRRPGRTGGWSRSSTGPASTTRRSRRGTREYGPTPSSPPR